MFFARLRKQNWAPMGERGCIARVIQNCQKRFRAVAFKPLQKSYDTCIFLANFGLCDEIWLQLEVEELFFALLSLGRQKLGHEQEYSGLYEK